jgi:hypothetical protein
VTIGYSRRDNSNRGPHCRIDRENLLRAPAEEVVDMLKIREKNDGYEENTNAERPENAWWGKKGKKVKRNEI